QRVSNTSSAIKLLATALDQHYRTVVEAANQENIPVNFLNFAGGDSRRARVLLVKFRIRQNFPMSFAEALQPWLGATGGRFLSSSDVPPVPSYVKTLQLANVDFTDPNILLTPQPCESSICLLMALQQNRKGVNWDIDSLPSGTI